MKRHRLEAVLLPTAVAVVLLVVWDRAVHWTGTKIFPTPAVVWSALVALAKSGELARSVAASAGRVAVGFSLATVIGIPVGLAMGQNAVVSATLDPLIQILRPISALAWIPIAVALLGIGSPSAIMLIFLGAVFPIVTSTTAAIHEVPEMYRLAGANLGLSSRELFLRVMLPAAVPRMLVGLRIALGVSWLVLVAAEMIAVNSGLGYMIIDARNAGKRYDLVIAAILVIGVIGLGLDVIARRAETLRAVRWGFRN